jgi:predicted DsbA family dithiol-disulfide isomerase
MQVEMWGDLVCPWCYLGRARFRRALADFEHDGQVEVVYRSFELDPDFPAGQQVAIGDLLTSKYGISPEQAQAAEQRIAGLAAGEGLPFSADRGHGNTLDAHRLVQLAAARGVQDHVLGALYQAHFGGTGSLFDAASLAGLATAAGLDRAEVDAVLAGADYTAEVRADEQRARQLGITGVPYAVAAGRLAVPGCQPTEVYAELLRTAWEQASPAA